MENDDVRNNDHDYYFDHMVKIIDHEISDHILAPVRGLQCCDPHPANKWHRAKDKVFS